MSEPGFPFDWYWRRDDAEGEVIFSSAREDRVPADDPAYRAFIAAGHAPTLWPRDGQGERTDEALRDVLAPYGLFVSLAAYAASVRFARETGGITVAGARIRTDRESQGLIAGAVLRAMRSPEAEIRFKADDGFVTLNAEAVMAVGDAVAEHVQACFRIESEVVAAIEAGEIAARAEVDAAFAIA